MSIHPTAIIDRSAQIDETVSVGPYAVIGPNVILSQGVDIGAHAVIYRDTAIGPHTKVHAHAVLGGDPQDLKYEGQTTQLVIGASNTFREFSTANRGSVGGGGVTTIGDHNLFMAYSHVAHDCSISNHCVLSNCASLAGHVTVGAHAILGGLTAVHQHSRIGRCAMLAGGAKVAQDVPPFTLAKGDRAQLYGLNVVGLRRMGFSKDTIRLLRDVYRDLFQQPGSQREAVKQIRQTYFENPEIMELTVFIEDSTRGVCRCTTTSTDPSLHSR